MGGGGEGGERERLEGREISLYVAEKPPPAARVRAIKQREKAKQGPGRGCGSRRGPGSPAAPVLRGESGGKARGPAGPRLRRPPRPLPSSALPATEQPRARGSGPRRRSRPGDG